MLRAFEKKTRLPNEDLPDGINRHNGTQTCPSKWKGWTIYLNTQAAGVFGTNNTEISLRTRNTSGTNTSGNASSDTMNNNNNNNNNNNIIDNNSDNSNNNNLDKSVSKYPISSKFIKKKECKFYGCAQSTTLNGNTKNSRLHGGNLCIPPSTCPRR